MVLKLESQEVILIGATFKIFESVLVNIPMSIFLSLELLEFYTDFFSNFFGRDFSSRKIY